MSFPSDRLPAFSDASFNPVAPFGIPKLSRLAPTSIAVRMGCIAAALLMWGLA